MEFKIMQNDNHVATIEAVDLNAVFEIGNIGPEDKIERLAPMHSISVGDVIVDEDEKSFSVDSMGFSEITFFEVRRGFVCDESPWTEVPSFRFVAKTKTLKEARKIRDELDAENENPDFIFAVFDQNDHQVWNDTINS